MIARSPQGSLSKLKPEILVKIQGSIKKGSPKRSNYSEIDDVDAFVVARNPQNPGVPQTGSPKRSVYSEIDDFGAFVGFLLFGGQKSLKSRGPQNRLSQKERLL